MLKFGLFAASEPKDADIIWTSMQVDEETKKALGLNDQQYINQFPFEACLVMKHHLAETVQKVIFNILPSSILTLKCLLFAQYDAKYCYLFPSGSWIARMASAHI